MIFHRCARHGQIFAQTFKIIKINSWLFIIYVQSARRPIKFMASNTNRANCIVVTDIRCCQSINCLWNTSASKPSLQWSVQIRLLDGLELIQDERVEDDRQDAIDDEEDEGGDHHLEWPSVRSINCGPSELDAEYYNSDHSNDTWRGKKQSINYWEII